MDNQSFINLIGDASIEEWKNSKVLPSIILAQACLESGFGNSALSQSPNFNLFGIKGTGPNGTVQYTTTEYVNGKPIQTIASFRKYHNWSESIHDHTELFINGVSWNHDFYKPVIGERDFNKVAEFLQGHYATDISYASKLEHLNSVYNLTLWDAKAFGEIVAPTPKQQPPKTVVSQASADYVIQAGDTLSKIAFDHHTTVSDILEDNPSIKDANLIHAGEKITFNEVTPSEIFYTVKSGDTLSEIAVQNKKTEEEILKLNPTIKNPNLIVVGEKIRIS